jgi:hypothetical protein
MYFTNNFIGVRPTHDEICEVWYRISREDVKWVFERCSVYALDEDKQSIAVVKPIETRCCIDRIEFDLMDFRSLTNSKFIWILQVKDTFLQYVWLYALKDKSSKEVANALAQWIGQNGNPWAFCCDNGKEFKGILSLFNSNSILLIFALIYRQS